MLVKTKVSRMVKIHILFLIASTLFARILRDICYLLGENFKMRDITKCFTPYNTADRDLVKMFPVEILINFGNYFRTLQLGF